MSGHTPLAPEQLESRRRLSQQVRNELAGAGLPVMSDVDPTLSYGVFTELDLRAPEDDAVYVSWQPHHLLGSAAMAQLGRGGGQSAVMSHFGAVVDAMTDAIAAILRSAGFQVEQMEESPELRVTAGSERSVLQSLLAADPPGRPGR